MVGRYSTRKLFVFSCIAFVFLVLWKTGSVSDFETRSYLNSVWDRTAIFKHEPLRPPHKLLPYGLVETNLDGRHPVLDLIEQGEAKWKRMLEKQSKTLQEAVDEYKKRYQRPPPLGFDHWWNFCVKHNVKLVDEFDQINQIIEPYFALSPSRFRQRVEQLETELPFSFHLRIKDGKMTVDGETAKGSRAENIASLVAPFAQWLPDLVMHASDHDRGNIVLGQDQYDEAIELARSREYFSDEDLKRLESPSRNPRNALLNACHEQSPAAEYSFQRDFNIKNTSHSFIHDFIDTMNYCTTPSHMYLHGVWSFHHTHETRLKPMWVHCKWIQDQSFLMPALPGFEHIIRPGAPEYKNLVPWSERRATRLFWRARSTGIDFNTGWDWRAAHRVRLHFLANPKGENITEEIELLVEEPLKAKTRAPNKLSLKKYKRDQLNKLYIDAGLVGPLVQCDVKTRPICDEARETLDFLPVVDQSQGQDAKYVIDVDGNGWSQRYGRLLSTGSVVFKSTVFPEWNTPWLIPFYHFVPVKVDYSDLYDLMAFFAGYPDGTPGHDDLAEKIAAHSVQFTQEHWRWEDMQAYMFRLLLEYARLGAKDRDLASFER